MAEEFNVSTFSWGNPCAQSTTFMLQQMCIVEISYDVTYTYSTCGGMN